MKRNSWLYLAAYLVMVVLLVATAGCATSRMPETVVIPVAQEKCLDYSTKPERPALPIKQLKKGDKPNAVVGSYAQTVELLAGYAEALETQMSACK